MDNDITEEMYLPPTFSWLNVNENTRITDEDYDRDARHY